MLEQLEQWDKDLFLQLNGAHNPTLDFLMPWISNKYVWIPLYLILIFLLFKKNRRKEIFIVVAIGLLILVSDQVASGILKPLTERLRPCYDPEISSQVHLLKGCGGRFSFASSHASNSFAIAFFCWLLLKEHYRYVWLLIPWAMLVAYSRVYIGVHFPGDILAGALIGIGATFFIWKLYDFTIRKRLA